MKPAVEMKIIFNGNTGQIDANTLIAALGHYQYIMESANKELGGDRTVELKINAIEKGSFVVDVDVVENLFKSLFSGSTVSYVSGIVTIVGGVYAGYKKLKGKAAKTDEQKSSIMIKGKDNVVINQAIVNIYNQIPVREAISKTLEAAEKDANVDGFTIEGGDEKTTFPRDEFKEMIHSSFENEEMLPPDRNIEEQALLSIVSMSFESGYQWQFMYKGFKIPIRIKEGPLMKLIDAGERFGKGDCIEVVLEIVQRYNPGFKAYENVRYKISKFIRHIPSPETTPLF